MHGANWDDLRYVLAVADLMSVSAAARSLGVNHATVLRRIAAFEEAHRVSLFERSAHGYRLRPEGAPVIEAARQAAEAMGRVSALLASTDTSGADVLRITSVDTLCTTVLGPGMRTLQKAATPNRVALLSSNERLDMARLQADIALRPATRLPDDLSGETVAQLGFETYAAPDAPDVWLGLGGHLSGSLAADWMRRNVPRDAVGAICDSFVTLREMAAAGEGRAILPCVLGDGHPVLRRSPGSGFPGGSVPIWIAVHRDLEDAPRLGPVRRALAKLVGQQAGRLSGQG